MKRRFIWINLFLIFKFFKNLTKEEFEQQTIRTISSSIIKAFQKISETNIPISEGFSTSDPLDPCSTSQIKNSDFNKEIENPFVKMCKFPPIIGSKESFNYSRRGVVLKENTPNISTNVEKRFVLFFKSNFDKPKKFKSFPSFPCF